jgi:hypothetical protein
MGGCCSKVGEVDKLRGQDTEQQQPLVQPKTLEAHLSDTKQELVEDPPVVKVQSPAERDLPPAPSSRKSSLQKEPTPVVAASSSRKSSLKNENDGTPAASPSPRKSSTGSKTPPKRNSILQSSPRRPSVTEAKNEPAAKPNLEAATVADVPSGSSPRKGSIDLPAPVVAESVSAPPPSRHSRKASTSLPDKVEPASPAEVPSDEKKAPEEVKDTSQAPVLDSNLSVPGEGEKRKRMFDILVKGQVFKKKNRLGIKQSKLFWVDKAHTVLHWAKESAGRDGKNAGIHLSTIKEVKADKEVGLLVISDKREIYLEAESASLRDKWVYALQTAAEANQDARRGSFSQSYRSEDDDE